MGCGCCPVNAYYFTSRHTQLAKPRLLTVAAAATAAAAAAAAVGVLLRVTAPLLARLLSPQGSSSRGEARCKGMHIILLGEHAMMTCA
jgi:hypothetical protein